MPREGGPGSVLAWPVLRGDVPASPRADAVNSRPTGSPGPTCSASRGPPATPVAPIGGSSPARPSRRPNRPVPRSPRCPHRDRSPEDDAGDRGKLRGAAEPCPEGAQAGQGEHRHDDAGEHPDRGAEDPDRDQRQHRADGEGERRGARRLEGPGTAIVGEAELVAGVGLERVTGRERLRTSAARAGERPRRS